MVSYLGHIVTKRGCKVQFVGTATTGSPSMKPEVAAFMQKIECK